MTLSTLTDIEKGVHEDKIHVHRPAPLTQHLCIEVDWHDSKAPSTLRCLLRHQGFMHVAWHTPSFLRYACPGV